MKLNGDIDIDFGNREKLLSLIDHIPASIRNNDSVRKHATGVYVTEIPYDPLYDASSLDYNEAERRGYFKLDLLNVHVYDKVKSESHLVELMREPNWALLKNQNFVQSLIHLGNQYHTLCRMPEPVNSIPRLAMFLAIVRPGKKHLVGKLWKEVAETVWDKTETGYSFKKAHGIAYAHLVAVHMNLLEENGFTTTQ